MLRAYSRGVVDAINSCKEVATFIPALAYTFARNPAEVVVEHEERAAGESKYSLYSLIRLNFDLMTGFSLVPLQMVLHARHPRLAGIGGPVRAADRAPPDRRPGSRGLFTLFALMFFLIGLALFGIGLLGEYVGRIYQQVRHRPRYLVEAILEQRGMTTAE
jgi:undecaprenyl-phosphate 4-deoxy-4-formamido-L-arabinose transferase